MAFKPDFSSVTYLVRAYDKSRPGWSFVWGGTNSKADARDMVRRFKERSGTAHITFKIEKEN